MALVLAVKMGLFLKDFSKCLRQSIARFPFILETDFSFKGGVRLGKPRPCKAKQPYEDLTLMYDLTYVAAMVAACSEKDE